ncbi:hypothetical protein [Acetobacter sp. KSO5]|uniref:hypothetical protein n=1 Tax=Acetobacter sp. KSO5 TaxID=3373674 RepID=UPI00376F34DC
MAYLRTAISALAISIGICGASLVHAEPSAVDPAGDASSSGQNSATCSEDWKACKDNADLMNNYSKAIDARVTCQMEAEQGAKFGTPVFPSVWSGGSFHSFLNGSDYPKKGYAILIENNAQFQNQYGAMVHSTVFCKYNFKSGKVDEIHVEPH